MFNTVLILLLFAVIIVQSILHKQERQDLYNRIMSRDLHEYNHHTDNETGKEKRNAEGSNLLRSRIRKARVGMFGDYKE